MPAVTGADIAKKADAVAADDRKRAVTYKMGGDASGAGKTSDCSHFVADVLSQAALKTPYVTITTIRTSPNWTEVKATDAKAGDVIVQGGHMGVYTGTEDAQKHPLGVQMGNSGAKTGPFGPGGWFAMPLDLHFYRPKGL